MHKKNNTRSSSTRKMLRFLPLFCLAACVFIILAGILLSIARIDETIHAVGFFEPYPRMDVKATVKDTVIENILVEVGEQVDNGKVLMHLKDQEQTREKIVKLEEKLKLAEMNLDRLRQLSNDGYIADKDREEAELKMKILTQDLSVLEKRAEALIIDAPSSGMVLDIPVRIGDCVDIGQKLVILAGSEERALRMWIDEGLSSEIKLGQKVRIYSEVFYYRKHGVALGEIVKIDSYPKLKDGKNHIEALAKITESSFPIRCGSQAKARVVIKTTSILRMIFGLER